MVLAETEIVSWALLTNVAGEGAQLKFTKATSTQFMPFTVSVKDGPPTTTLDGLRDEIVGGGRKTLNGIPVELPPPGAGFKTVTSKVPALATSPAKIEAVSWVGLTNVVGLADPPNDTVELVIKFVPLMVSVKPPLPT